MSIASKLTKLETDISNSYDAIDVKGGTIPQYKNTDNLSTAINSIPTGTTPTGTINITTNGTHDVTNYATANVNVSGSSGEKDVIFYDYDGTIVNSYTKAEFLALSSMPSNPSHIGLVAQGWNWSLADAQDYVTDYDRLDIGQMYTTASGLSEFDIELNAVTGLTVRLNMDGTKNWGDGTSDTNTTHTYSNTGKYTITCNGTTMTSSSSNGLFGQSNSAINYYATNVRLSNITSIENSAFSSCYSLTNVTIPDSVTSIGNSAFSSCYSLTNVTIPDSVTSIGNYVFYYCTGLTSVTIPDGVTSIGQQAFYNCTGLTSITIPDSVTNIGSSAFSTCYSLTNVTIPDSVTSIGSSAFSTCYSLILYDFTSLTFVPTLGNSNAFTRINSICKIVVPDNLYNSWKVATNWSNYANYIIKESDYNAS